MSTIYPHWLRAVTVYGVVWYFRNTSRTQDVALAFSNSLNLSEDVLAAVLERAERLAASRGTKILVTNLAKTCVMASGTASSVVRDFFLAQEVMWMQMDLLPCYIKLRVFGPGYDQLLVNERLRAVDRITDDNNSATRGPLLIASATLEDAVDLVPSDPVKVSTVTPVQELTATELDETAISAEFVLPETHNSATATLANDRIFRASQATPVEDISEPGRGNDAEPATETAGDIAKKLSAFQHCPGITSDGTKCSRRRIMTPERSTERWFCSKAHRRQWHDGETITR